MNRKTISIRRCADYNIENVSSAVSKALEPLGGMGAFVKNGDKVLIKPNLLKASAPDKAVTTHPAMVEVVVNEVHQAGGRALVGDSPGLGKIENIFNLTGMTGVAQRTGAELVEFKESVKAKGRAKSDFSNIEIAKNVVDADRVINLPKIKTHAQMTITAGVKNCFGCVVGKRKPQWHFKAGVSRERFADLLIDIFNAVNPCLTIADGVTVMEGNGPGSGDPRELGLIFASADTLGLDRVISYLLGFRESDVPLFCAARSRGLITSGLECMDIAGPDPTAAGLTDLRLKDFKMPKTVGMMFGPPFLRRTLRKAVTARPDIDSRLCAICMECIKICPAEAMFVKDKTVKIDYEECIRCFCCQEICPKGAITAKQGWLLRLFGANGQE